MYPPRSSSFFAFGSQSRACPPRGEGDTDGLCCSHVPAAVSNAQVSAISSFSRSPPNSTTLRATGS